MNFSIVSRTPLLASFLDDFDNLFFNWPVSAKPPIDSFPVLDTDGDAATLKGWEIQMALAGFLEEDVKVWNEDNILHISGDNTSSDVLSTKFICKFHHKIPVSKDLDLAKSKVVLSHGILSIIIPTSKSDISKTLLFGKE